MFTKNAAHVEALIRKATEVGDAGEAMKFSQAACNAANAICTIVSLDHQIKEQQNRRE